MESPHPHKHRPGITHGWRAARIALQGLRDAWRHEDAFRQEVIIALVAIPAALLMPVAPLGKVLMIASILLVLIVELINSAIEVVVDYISLDHHPLAKRAKDIASAAVFLSIMDVLVVWGLVIYSSLP